MNRQNRISTIIFGTTLITGMAVGVPTNAQTISEVIERQHDLADLDHRIEKNERLIRLQEQRVEFASVGTAKQEKQRAQSQGNTQTEYFGQRPNQANNQGQSGQPHELATPEKTPEEKRKERILSRLDNAVLAEAYVPKGEPSNKLVGVISVDDRGFLVKKGSVIDGWKAISVELDRVIFENQEFSARKTVFQAQ
tara:strand:- start:249 stop:833 length:585 start_codon:yes stop_codon:yes gene_type:complete